MKQYTVPFAGAPRRAADRAPLAAAVLSALVLMGLLSPGDSEGAGPYDVGSSVSEIEISVDGACDAGTLQESIPATGGIGLIFDVSDVGIGCLATDAAPSVVLIDEELIAFSNINTATTEAVSAAAQPNPTLALRVGDTTGFPSSGQVYVGSELMTYTSKTNNTFYVTERAKGTTTKQTLPIGSFVRAQGMLKLVGRGLPKYLEGETEAETAEAPHYSGATVRSPKTYLTCLGWLEQTPQSGLDSVFLRSRCYAILEPGYDPPSEPFWPVPYPEDAPVLSMAPAFWHDLSVGQIDEGTGALWLVTDYLGYQCFAYAEGELWVKISSDIQIDKGSQAGLGDFNILVYDNADCDGPPASALGGTGNLSSTEIDRRTEEIPWSTDTDGDCCPDGNELNANQQQGGLRDPFNPWDYMNPTRDGQNRVDDILATVNQYFIDEGNPEYDVDTDRTGLIPGPGGWNLGPPNGQQRVDDILASVKSYFHDCSLPVGYTCEDH